MMIILFFFPFLVPIVVCLVACGILLFLKKIFKSESLPMFGLRYAMLSLAISLMFNMIIFLVLVFTVYEEFAFYTIFFLVSAATLLMVLKITDSRFAGKGKYLTVAKIWAIIIPYVLLIGLYLLYLTQIVFNMDYNIR